ncbi:MAG: hypothetical protein VYB17_04605 [Candidatus Thermoplasmatota archaeon]|nr:hypothetical protein [Candidatus Thermoplasmatota archaeon]
MIWNQQKIILSVMMSALLLVSSSPVAMNALSEGNVGMDISTMKDETIDHGSKYDKTTVANQSHKSENKVNESCVCPCETSPSPNFINKKWASIANLKVSDEIYTSGVLKKELEYGGARLHNFDYGSGDVRTDFYGVIVCLEDDPSEYLKSILNNPNGFDNGEEFYEWVEWEPASKSGRQQGDIVNLNIWAMDNGAIMYLDVDLSDNEFCVMTVENKKSGTHPISGTRCFGFEKMSGKEVMFYTYSIESATIWGTGGIGAEMQHNMWVAMMGSIATEVENNGGEACGIYYDDEWHSLGKILKDLKGNGQNIKPTLLDNTGTVDGWLEVE